MSTLNLSRTLTTELDGLDSDAEAEGILRRIGPDRIGFIVEPSGGVASIRPEVARR